MYLGLYETDRLIVESASAIICFVLVWFMMKPYKLTRKGSYLGLPLGFGFLGVSYLLGAISNAPIHYSVHLMWMQFLSKTFAFVFIAATYFFSARTSKKGNLLGNLTISLLIIALASSILLSFIAPEFSADYTVANEYLRVVNVALLVYVSAYTLWSHTKNLDSSTIWIPFGFIFLAISQYTLLFWYSDSSLTAFWAAIVLRFIGLIIFLFVACRSFYSSNERAG